MDTILINCSKDKAKVNDENGRFKNEVSQGIVINKGDRVSLEGIAVNSTGVGTNVIEIPRSLKNWSYMPNAIELEVSFYINHNHSFTCLAPLVAPAPAVYAVGSAKSGYMDKTIAPSGAGIEALKQKGELNQAGMKFYPLSVSNPERQVIGGALPYERVYERQKAKLRLEVPIGYDSPQNIADSITQQIHKTNPVGGISRLSLGVQANPTNFQEQTNQPSGYTEFSTTLKDGSTRLLKSNWTENDLVGDQNNYYTCFAAGNPDLWEYGTKLLNSPPPPLIGIAPKNNGYLNFVATNPGYTSDIYFTYDPPIDPGNPAAIKWLDGYVLTTNLAYEWVNCDNVARLLQSQKCWLGAELNTEQMKKTPDRFTSRIPLGRVDDANIGTSLVCPINLPLTAGRIASGGANNPYPNATCFSYYVDASYKARFLGSAALAAGAVIGRRGFENTPNLIKPGTTQAYTPEELAKYMNCMVVPVRNSWVDAGVHKEEWNIGIVMKAFENTGLISGRNYCLVDLGFTNPQNPCVYLVNPTKISGAAAGGAADTYNRQLQVGSPNALMGFDGDRGRFYFSDLHWSYRIGSGSSTSAVPSAENVVIEVNTPTTLFSNAAGTLTPFTKYSWSGISLENVAVYEKETFNSVPLIGDTYGVEFEPADWKRCLFGRLGFDYSQLFSKYGRPDAIFNPLYYETTIPSFSPNAFPYPLTTNPELDTALALGLSVNSSSLPMFDLNTEGGFPKIQLSVSSAQIFANNLPNKLVFPYWLIYSDIINGINFHSVEDGEVDNIIAVCNRAYISGDFAFSFATDYVFTATKDYVITGITTQILNPDLSPADVDDGTSVIYKIQKPIPMFQVHTTQSNQPKNAVEFGKDEASKEHSHTSGFKRNPVIDRKDRTEIDK